MQGRSVARYLAAHECRALVAERTPWLIAVVLVACVGYALFSGLQWKAFQQRTIQTAHEEQQRRYGNLQQDVADITAGRKPPPFADPRAPDMVGSRMAWTYAAMPPLALAPLSIGQSDVLPYYFRVSTASRETVLSTSEIENPHRLLHGRLDLSFVLVFLLPLLIIGLGYNAISIEKEEGTLALLLSQPVALEDVVIVKLASRAGLVAGLVLVLAIAGVATSGIDLSADTAARLALWTGIVVAYGAFWFAVTVLVTSWGRGSATNALALTAVWLLLVVVFPAMLNIAVSALYPMPSRVEMIEAVRAATDSATARGNRLLAKYYGDHPELVADTDLTQAMNDVAITKLAIDDEVDRRVRPVADRYDQQLARQQRFVNRVRLLSPAIVAQDALNDVAGTGAARYRHFVAQVAEYHEEWRDYISSLVVRKMKFDARMYEELPQFTYQEEALTDVIWRVGIGTIVLIAAAMLLVSVGVARLREYPTA